MPNCDREHILTFLSQLLNPKISAATLSHYFPAKQIFWDRLVQLGSWDLVLPAVHGALKRKKLEPHVPKDLWSYLEKISDLNLKRNTYISKQITSLREIFNKHQIEHVFLKGAAMLVTKHYDALLERMVGDIDILIAEKDLLESQQILLNFGYTEQVRKGIRLRPEVAYASERHLNRLNHPDFIASVELHVRTLNQNKSHYLPSDEILKVRRQTTDGYWIPSLNHLWKHAILNWQYNDRGYQYNWLSIRTVVDVLHLEPKNTNDIVNKQSHVIQHFYSLMSFFYNEYSVNNYCRKALFCMQIRYTVIQKIVILNVKLKLLAAKIFNRIDLFFKSKKYRSNLFKNPKLLIRKIVSFWKTV